MNILLHTIAIEPARWIPQRVHRPLVELLPEISAAKFPQLEIFEPHLTAETASLEIKNALAQHGFTPVVLSSYLSLNPADTSDAELQTKLRQIEERVAFYGFRKLRLFPGPKMPPSDNTGVQIFTERLRLLVDRIPNVEVLLETHDDSLADDPAVVVSIVVGVANSRVGLLFQATFFQDQTSILEQFRIQKPYIRHCHLQNRMPDYSLVSLKDGIVPWSVILKELGSKVDASLEFVPVGVCSVEQFDLAATLRQVDSEADYIRGLVGSA